jgi:hypothetical protein
MNNIDKLTLMIDDECNKIKYLSFEDYPIIKQVNRNYITMMKR